MIPLLRCLPILLGLIALLGCNSTTVEENEAIPVPTAETAAEDAYGTTFMNLMVEFKANADLANQELDEAMAKGLPKDPKERRSVLMGQLERSDKRAEALLAKAQDVEPPPRYADFHAAVTTFLKDVVDGNTRYRTAFKNANPNTSKISEENLQSMLKNYEKMKSEGQKIGIPMVDLSI